MKTKIFLLLFISYFTTVAQTNYSIVEGNKLWSNLKQSNGGGPPPYFKQTSYIKFDGDTVIGLWHYKHVFESLDSLHQNWNLIGFIREDLSKKVFYLPIENSFERLLYDFGANVGDTIHIWSMGSSPRDLVVTNIDYVFIYNKNLKRLTLSNFGEQWIEGIGSLEGLLASGTHDLAGVMYDLLCYYENDTLKYSNPNFTNCYIQDVGIDVQKQNKTKVTIYPNPVSSKSVLYIENLPYDDCILEIYSLLGEKIKSIPIFKNQKVFINKLDYVDGIYFYRLSKADQNFASGKFSIE